ncbi:phosphopantetheine-binding protein [Streptomyces caniferus]|uniref:phosphopantetheine-binding protein n=1 Tax=Streptomyces caniferus TaxID=285557 RepID=UPI0033D6D0D4
MLNAQEIQGKIHSEIVGLLAEAELPIPVLTGSEILNKIGLSSLLLARLVIQLEAEFGFDPFEEEYVISDVRTLKALVDAYVDMAGRAAVAA